LVQCVAIQRQSLGLRDHGRLPLDAEPGQVFEHSFDIFGFGPLGVEVFVAEQESAVVNAGSLEGLPEGSGVAEVE
jgi:hypothetical protein